MKKLEKLQKELDCINTVISKVSFERKDTSYRRSGGYFGTHQADTSGVVIVSSFARTKHLNTYTCVNHEHNILVEKRNLIIDKIKQERERLFNISQNKWAKTSIEKCIEITDRQIKDGTINTNYAKIFIEGNNNIYGAHPHYKHSDYNKFIAMPNTPKHRLAAKELNERMIAAGLKLNI